ncbi:hypothetical protein PQX77_020400 [Marasmius sp. AFHP31]|nr:hypothetical protein PQX77_020400 [Marasmius sp. AFHP31]
MLVERAEPPNIGPMAGPVAIIKLIGYLLNWGLFGVLVVQVFLYYLAFPRDKWTMKALVYGLFLMDTAQSILVTHEAFVKYGLGFGNVRALAEVGTGWLSFPIIGAINAITVQLFFAHRIVRLSESKILGALIAIVRNSSLGCEPGFTKFSQLAIIGGAGGLTTGVQAKIINNLPQLSAKAKVAITIWLTTTAACDIVIAAAMTLILSKKRTGFNAKTDDVITNIIRLTVETGTLTAVLAILIVILYFVFPKASYWNAPTDFLGKLYSNNLLVILNSRMKISDGTDSSGPQTSYSRHKSQSGSRNGQISVTQADMPVINIQREVWESKDDFDGNENLGAELNLPPPVRNSDFPSRA